MIITVANRKGGVGKTTTSVFLAHAVAEATGVPCTIVDADPQASTVTWAQRCAAVGTPLGVSVRQQSLRQLSLTACGPHVVIDTPPADPDFVGAAVRLADLVLVPTSASALDLSMVESTVALAADFGKPAAVLLTQTRRTKSVGEAVRSLEAEGVRVLRTHIPLREAVANAFGRPVRQLHGYDLALAEIRGALPAQPYSVDAVRARAERPRPARIEPISLAPRVTAIGPRHASVRTGAFGDDEMIQRLKASVAKLAN